MVTCLLLLALIDYYLFWFIIHFVIIINVDQSARPRPALIATNLPNDIKAGFLKEEMQMVHHLLF